MSEQASNQSWLSSDLENTSNWQFSLTDSQKKEILDRLKHLKVTCYEDIKRSDCKLNELTALMKTVLGELEHGLGLFLLRGIPIDLLSAEDSKKLAIVLGFALGTPVFQDVKGSKIVDIRSTDADLGDAVNYKLKADGNHMRPYETRVAFCLHSDPSDVASLLCLNQAARGGRSLLVSSLAVHNQLKSQYPELLDQLYQPLCYVKPPSKGQPISWHRIPVFSWQEGYFKSHVVPDLVRISQQVDQVPRLTSLQQEALSKLEEIAMGDEYCYGLELQPGDMLLVNNHLVFHGRSAYEDSTNNYRHLLRMWLAVSGSRPLDPIHEPWFGNPARGALRGGYLRDQLEKLVN